MDFFNRIRMYCIMIFINFVDDNFLYKTLAGSGSGFLHYLLYPNPHYWFMVYVNQLQHNII